MKEKWVIIGFVSLLLITFFFSYVTQFFQPPYYPFIHIQYSKNNSYLYIVEEQFLVLGEGNNVVYRSFVEPICVSSDKYSECKIEILNVSCKYGSPYISYEGRLHTLRGSPEYVLRKISSNEVGCWSTGYKEGQEEVLTIVYRVPLSHVEYNKWIHVLFSENHPAIRVLKVKPLEGGAKTYFLMPSNAQLKIDVRNGILHEYFLYLLVPLITFLLLLIPYFIWYKYGREKKFEAPEYLYNVPMIKGEKIHYVLASVLHYEGIHKNTLSAILLRLKEMGVIKELRKRGLVFKKVQIVLDKNWKDKIKELSTIEKDFLETLIRYCDKVQETSDSLVLEGDAVSIGRKLYHQFVSKYSERLISKFVDRTGTWFVLSWGVFGGMFVLFVYTPLVPNIYSVLLGMEVVFGGILLSTRPSLFGKFKREWYKVKLEVEAFRKFLGNVTMLREYALEDITIWKEWLLYATALGVADKVLKVMKEKFPLELVKPYEECVRTSIIVGRSIYYVPSPTPGGEGIGTGGGFGGGGGGAR